MVYPDVRNVQGLIEVRWSVENNSKGRRFGIGQTSCVRKIAGVHHFFQRMHWDTCNRHEVCIGCNEQTDLVYRQNVFRDSPLTFHLNVFGRRQRGSSNICLCQLQSRVICLQEEYDKASLAVWSTQKWSTYINKTRMNLLITFQSTVDTKLYK